MKILVYYHPVSNTILDASLRFSIRAATQAFPDSFVLILSSGAVEEVNAHHIPIAESRDTTNKIRKTFVKLLEYLNYEAFYLLSCKTFVLGGDIEDLKIDGKNLRLLCNFYNHELFHSYEDFDNKSFQVDSTNFQTFLGGGFNRFKVKYYDKLIRDYLNKHYKKQSKWENSQKITWGRIKR
jgi:hypothetical protein